MKNADASFDRGLHVGVDIGGTFTDTISIDSDTGAVGLSKVPSTTHNQAVGFLAGLRKAGVRMEAISWLVHGTTVGTNATLERNGAVCGLITTRGFRDIIELGRRERPHLFGLFGEFEPLIRRRNRLEVDERLDAEGNIVVPLNEQQVGDLVFADGAFGVVGMDLRCTLEQLAGLAEEDAGGLSATMAFQPPGVTFPNGCHVCEVEVDPDTGEVFVLRYVAVEDVGRVLNPVLVDGQLHGGIAQGLGQALIECARYEPGSGQLVTGSFLDYAMPRAADLPHFATDTRPTITAVNPLGAKGVGEAGTVGSLVAAINAICDAVATLGIAHMDMPANPSSLWTMISSSRSR